LMALGEKAETKAEAKAEKQKPKEGGERRGTWNLYKIDGGTVKLTNKKCPRCGKVMAFHKDPQARWACGGCQYTEYAKR